MGLAACGFLVFVVLLWRWRQQDRRWHHEPRVHQGVAERLEQASLNPLTPEARQRREAYRHHVLPLRARAEAELAAAT